MVATNRVPEGGRSRRVQLVYFTWGSRVYWASQALMLMTGVFLVSLGFVGPYWGALCASPLVVLFIRELRMGLVLCRDGKVVIRGAFRDWVADSSSILRLRLNQPGEVESAMWGREWRRISTVLVLKNGEVRWVNGIEARFEFQIVPIIQQFNGNL